MSTIKRDGIRSVLRGQQKLRAYEELGIKQKRRLTQRETYEKAPPGYVFMPLGTPELADYCKDLSHQQGFPIHVVNAKPTSKIVLDPTKISHHVQRIGYHFKDTIVEEACTRLHYLYSEGKFVSEADVRQHSFVAQVMAKHGLKATKLTKHETPEKLRAAIRELFPAIPGTDLDEVVKHAWDQKESRVGTAEGMDLSRRIQLAVLARIRHKYTDYDVLLKTFDWVQCRREVEPVCLKKLLEWRGESSDDGLEEIVAETMLLDEQSDVPRQRLASHSRRISGYETGDASDASIEVTHRVAVADDLRPESPHERGYMPVQSYAERHDLARAKIQAARAQMQHQQPHAQQVERIHIATDERGHVPSQIVINGKILRRASPQLIQQPQAYGPIGQRYQPVHGAPALIQQAHTPQQAHAPQQVQAYPSYQPQYQAQQQQAMPLSQWPRQTYAPAQSTQQYAYPTQHHAQQQTQHHAQQHTQQQPFYAQAYHQIQQVPFQPPSQQTMAQQPPTYRPEYQQYPPQPPPPQQYYSYS